jgi:transcription initiation factor TFIIIB Brf1 subunit/transcription initiation factor TFIIB
MDNLESSDEFNDYNELDELDELSDDKIWNILDNITADTTNKRDIVDIMDNKTCKNCSSTNMLMSSSRGCFVCQECGTETTEILDDSPEWNNYEDGANNGRCSAPTNIFMPKSSLGTTINVYGYSKIKTLRKWGNVTYRERSLVEVLNDMETKCKTYNITKAIIDHAKILYKNIRESKHEDGINKGKNVIIRGVNRKQIIAACLFFGTILQKSPRSTKEVADIFNLKLTQITKGCRKFLELSANKHVIFNIKPSHGEDFIDRFGKKLKLSKEILELAIKISINTYKLDIATDHQPLSIAAASILLAVNIYNIHLSKKSISEVFKISEVTITKTYNKFYPYQKIIVSDDKTNLALEKIQFNFLNNSLNIYNSELDESSPIIDNDENKTESETESIIVKVSDKIQENSTKLLKEPKKRGRKPKSKDISNS